MPRKPKPLTPIQERYVLEYLIDLNSTAAYKRAGYKCTGKAAESAAGYVHRNPQVQAKIREELAKREKRSAADVDRLELEAERLALADIRKLFDEHGALKPVAEWDADTAAAVMSLEVEEIWIGRGQTRKLVGYLKKIKINSDKLAAILALLKRRDIARAGELGSKANPIHHRIGFIEFADADPGDGEAVSHTPPKSP